MNILYIGPYKHASIQGIQSQVNLFNLSQTNHNVYAKHYGPKNANISNDLLFLENKPIITNIDMVVEHKKLSDISMNQSYDSVLLPIFDIYEHINIYQNYKNIAVNHYIEHDILNHNNIDSQILQNQLNLPTDNNKNMDLKLYQFHTKIYCVSDLNTDVNIVYLLVSSFAYMLQHLPDHCLIILLNNSNNQHLKRFSEFITKISHKIGIDLSQKILLVNSQTCDLANIDYIHKTCDIFLNINNKESINSFNYNIANYYNNRIINDISSVSMIDGGLEIGINYQKLLENFNLLSIDMKAQHSAWPSILK